MARGTSPRRYAQAIFHIALEKNELEKWQVDLQTLDEPLKEPQLLAFLQSPRVSFPAKARVCDELLPNISPMARNLLHLLIYRNRLAILPDIVTEYARWVDTHKGIKHIEIAAAIPLSQQDQEHLQKRLGKLTGKEVVLSSRTEPELLGGVVIRIGDKVIDGSIRTRLQELKGNLLQGS